MKKNYLLLFALLGCMFGSQAQFTDDIESYDLGQLFTSRWTTWNGANDGLQNAIVTADEAASGTKSIFIGPGQGPQDVILDFNGVADSGTWNAKWLMYVPAGNSAYFNVQGNVNPNAEANMEFLSGNIFFNADNLTPGEGVNQNNSAGDFPFTFPHDQWFFVGIEVNIDDQTYNLNINGNYLGGLPYSDFAERFDGIDFFSLDSSTSFYLDDVEFAAGPLVFETVPPVANCAGDFTISLDVDGNASIEAEDIDDGSTDNSGVVNLGIDISEFDCSNIGDNTVTLTVSDPSGNTATCTALITVEDNTAPTANCSSATYQLDQTGNLTISASDIDNNSTDACGIDSMSIDVTTFDCDDIGENQVVLTVNDVNGNTSTCTATITIETFNLCPEDVVVNNDPGSCVATNVDLGAPITSESCSTITSVTNDAPMEFETGVTTVTWTTTYTSGDVVTCQQAVTVNDNEAPVVTCPEDFTVQIDSGEMYEVPDFYSEGDFTAEDNCTQPLTITQNPAVGTLLSDGTYTVNIAAEDNYENSSECSFQVTVETILGTEDFDLNSIALYPNPAKNVITISNPSGVELEEIQIYDMSGRLLKSTEVGEVKTEFTLDISTLSPSTYFLILKGADVQRYKHIIKE